ncbi:Hypothetical protein LUCI_4624 [Lucifera butyrica]|uniref:HEPN AbiJ-N-terminal domain-containing protein n=1 Tax=Lucifera butyrica TaxID=1351585 RepID=A0A498RCR1_9FIRM|nr:Hypothetical protein LUCI_4624 [Lucifera butyrica]
MATHDNDDDNSQNFIKLCNNILEKEMSGYRFVNRVITSITSKEEIDSIEQAIKNSDRLNGASTHFNSALQLLSDRKNPDYRNSIKESISAIESTCMVITGDSNATLGKALKTIESSLEKELHPALRGAFEKLYGYTSDAEGIRHGLMEEPNLKFEDAKFMLVVCSGFVNYLKDKIKD